MIDLHKYEPDTAAWVQTQVGNIYRRFCFTLVYNCLTVQVELSVIFNFPPSDLSNSREYNRLKNKLSNMEMEGIRKLTGCMKPCHYRLPFSTPCTIYIGQCKTFWRATWVGLKFKHGCPVSISILCVLVAALTLIFLKILCLTLFFKTGNTYFLKISKQRACNRTFSCPQNGRCPTGPGLSSP